MPATRWYKVNDPKNSTCVWPLPTDRLDWANWWQDVWPDGHQYLHVYGIDDDTVQRVRCRRSDYPRIGMRDGELCWMVDPGKSLRAVARQRRLLEATR